MPHKDVVDSAVLSFLYNDDRALYLEPTTTQAERDALARCVAGRASGEIAEAIVLMKARTDTAHFQALPTDAIICFIKGRLRFPGHKSGATFPSALIYFGSNADLFKQAFSPLGPVWQFI